MSQTRSLKPDWNRPDAVVYVEKPLPDLTWWERGDIRFCALSYSLWARKIWNELKGLDPKGRRFAPPVWAPWMKVEEKSRCS